MAPDMNPPATAPAFLAEHGWGGAEVEPLAGDASFRRYFRVRRGRRSAMLMDAPPPHEDPRPVPRMSASGWPRTASRAPAILRRATSSRAWC